jgi:hypothetical protein
MLKGGGGNQTVGRVDYYPFHLCLDREPRPTIRNPFGHRQKTASQRGKSACSAEEPIYD